MHLSPILEPAWLKPFHPDIQLDFEHDRFHGTTVSRAYPPLRGSMCSSTFSQNDVITGLTKEGKVQLMKLRELRYTNMGLWAENVRGGLLLHSRDMTITHQLSVTGVSGVFQDGETITTTGGGSGVYVLGNSNITSSPRLYAIRNGSGTFSGTMTGSTSGATGTITGSLPVWVHENCTVTKNQIGNDTVGAANQACLITATADNAKCYQSITRASAQFNYSAYVRRSSGSGSIYLTQDNYSNTTDITASLSASAFYRGGIPAATLTDPTCGVLLATSGDAIVVDFNHGDSSSYATTPIITKTASITISTDEPLLNDIDNGNFGYVIIRGPCILQPITAQVDFSAQNCDNVIVLFQGSGTSLKMNITTGGQLNCTNSASSVAQTSNSINLGYGARNKAIATVTGKEISVCLNGGPVATAIGKFLGSGTYDHMGVCNSASYNNSASGFAQCLTLWYKGLGYTELQQSTQL